jgi:hypothetical protein
MSTNPNFATSGLLCGTRFVLVNDRLPRTDQHCALCLFWRQVHNMRHVKLILPGFDDSCHSGLATEPGIGLGKLGNDTHVFDAIVTHWRQAGLELVAAFAENVPFLA